jgi:hypothetical protein
MKNSECINFVVVSDFRSHPLNAAIAIYKSLKRKKKKVKLIVAKKYFDSQDCGSHLPYLYKLAKYWWLRIWHVLAYVQGREDTELTKRMENGINSSLQSITCDSGASKQNYPRLYASLHRASIGAQEIMNTILADVESIDKVYIFNGRTAASYPIARGCFDKGISVEFYEYSHRNDGYKLYPCAPHSTTRLGKAVTDFRKVCILSSPNFFTRANAWKLMRLSNPYTKEYKKLAQKSFDVVVFLGSDHEYTCLDEDISEYRYIGNFELVKLVLAKYGTNSKIAVRAHPNQAIDKNYKIKLCEIEKLCTDSGVTYYQPNSKISSYDLIRNSNITAVEFSSIAYDAILLGRKVDLFNDLDLKYFLSSLTTAQSNDAEYVSQYICEIMCLYDELYFEKFDILTSFVCWFCSRVEWVVLKSSTPKYLC